MLLLLSLTYSSPTIDGVVGTDWASDEVVAWNTVSASWSGYELDTLYVTWDAESLYIGIEGSINASDGNVVLVYLDTDFGSDDTTSGFNDRWDFNDESGNLDQAITGKFPQAVPISGFYADWVIGTKDQNSVNPGNTSDYAGLRQIEYPQRTDFWWFSECHVAATTGGDVEIAIAWERLDIDTGAVLGMFVVIKNWDGDYISNQCLPEDGSPGVVNAVVTIPVDADSDGIPDSNVSPSDISSIVTTSPYTYHIPSVDGAVAEGDSDWNANEHVLENTTTNNWKGNSLSDLYVTWDRYDLFIGVRDTIQNSGNAFLLYLDIDFDADKNDSGFCSASDVADNTGTLDDAITGTYPDTVEIGGFLADWVLGETWARSLTGFESPNDSSGLRKIEDPGDFWWYSVPLRITAGGDLEAKIPWDNLFGKGRGFVDTGAVLALFCVIKDGTGDNISNEALPDDPDPTRINCIWVIPIDQDSNGIPDEGVTPEAEGYVLSTPYVLLSDSTEPPRNELTAEDSFRIWIYADPSYSSVDIEVIKNDTDTFYVDAAYLDPSTHANPEVYVGKDTFECQWYAVIPEESLDVQDLLMVQARAWNASGDTVKSGNYKGKYTTAWVRTGVSMDSLTTYHTLRTDCSMEDWRSNEELGYDNPAYYNITWDSLYIYVNFHGFNPDYQKLNIAFDVNPGSDTGTSKTWSGAYFPDPTLRPDYVVQIDATSQPYPKVWVSRALPYPQDGWETAADSSRWMNWVEKVSFGFAEVRIPRSFFNGELDPDDDMAVFMWIEDTNLDVWSSFPLQNADETDDPDPENLDVPMEYAAYWSSTGRGVNPSDFDVLEVTLTFFNARVTDKGVMLSWRGSSRVRWWRLSRDGKEWMFDGGEREYSFLDRWVEKGRKYVYILENSEGEKRMLEVLVGGRERRRIKNMVKNEIDLKMKERYEIFDVAGRKVMRGEGRKVDVSRLPCGIYWIRTESLKEKFIKL